MIVVDTGPLVAIANDRDQHHERCRTLLEQHPGPILVPAPVVVEVCQLLASRRGTRSEALFLASLAAAELEVVEKYADLPIGAVDACVVAIAERLGATEIATLDRRHFTVVRSERVGGFTILPG